jgi:hypothetical protein
MSTPVLELLQVPGCPNAELLLQRITQAVDLPVTRRNITTETEAVQLGMTGSPTLLVNGSDPFASPDTRACSLSCRLYRDPFGRVIPVPSVTQLHNDVSAEG